MDKLGMYKLTQINSSVIEHGLIDELWDEGLSVSVMTKCKNIAVEILRSAAADKLISSVPVVDFTMPEAKCPEDQEDRSARTNCLNEEELKAYVAECKRTYTPG